MTIVGIVNQVQVQVVDTPPPRVPPITLNPPSQPRAPHAKRSAPPTVVEGPIEHMPSRDPAPTPPTKRHATLQRPLTPRSASIEEHVTAAGHVAPTRAPQAAEPSPVPRAPSFHRANTRPPLKARRFKPKNLGQRSTASELRPSASAPGQEVESGSAGSREKRQRGFTVTRTMSAMTPVEKKRKGGDAQALLPAHILARGHWAQLPPRRVLRTASASSDLFEVSVQLDAGADELE